MIMNGEMIEGQQEDYLAEYSTGMDKIHWKNKSLIRRIEVYETGNVESTRLQDAQ
jgi:hypothetical protein